MERDVHALARYLPSGDTAMLVIGPEWPRKTRMHVPLCTSHNRQVISLDPVARYSEFGCHRTTCSIKHLVSNHSRYNRIKEYAHRRPRDAQQRLSKHSRAPYTKVSPSDPYSQWQTNSRLHRLHYSPTVRPKRDSDALDTQRHS